MGVYKMGLQTTVRTALWEQDSYRRGVRVSGFEVWEGVKTPGAIRDEVSRIDAQVKATGTDLFKELERRGGFPPDLKDRPAAVLPLVRFYENTWSPFAQEWQVYAVKHGAGSGWSDNFWGGAWEGAQDLLKTLQSMREGAKKAGFDLGDSTDIVKPEDSSISKAGSDLWSMLKTLFYLGVFMVAGIALVQVVRLIR